MTLGQNIQNARKAKGMSQETLAEKIGVSRQALGKWEKDTALPGLDNLQALAAELGVKLGVTPEEIPGRILQAVKLYDLPDAIVCSRADYETAVGLDKKGTGNAITLILLDKLGEAKPVRMDKQKLLTMIEDAYGC